VLYSESDQRWKLADFGTTSEGTAKRSRATQDARGTSSYRAPEILCEDPKYTNKVDIWAFGCILFEMCTGRKAFAGDFAVQGFAASGVRPVMFAQPPTNESSMADQAKQIEEWVFEPMRIEPAKRPSAEELLYKIWDRFRGAVAGMTEDRAPRYTSRGLNNNANSETSMTVKLISHC
jgi:serine/threonine protein kinase